MPGGRPKLLIVGPRGETAQALAAALADRYEVLKTDPEDLGQPGPTPELILTDSHTLPMLTGSLAAELESGRAITLLNAMGEGVCLASNEGDVLWSNDFFRTLEDEVADQVAGVCRDSSEWFEALSKIRPGREEAYPRPGVISPPGESDPELICRFELQTNDGQRFYAVVVSQVQAGGVTGAGNEQTSTAQVAAVVRDITANRRMRQKMNAIDAAGNDLVGVGPEEIRTLNAAERLQTLETKIVGHMAELLKFDHFAIFLLDNSKNKLELVITEGLPNEISQLDFFLEAHGSGITGYVASTGKSYICSNTETDERYVPGLAGCASSLTVPLMLNHRTIGVIAIESKQANAFTEEDRQFAEMFCRHIAVALHMLDLLVAERQTVNQNVSGRVQGELDEPLDDIMHEADDLLDEIRVKDPEAAAHIDRIKMDVESIRRRVREVAAGPQTLLGVERAMAMRTKDPVMIGRRVMVADDTLKIRRIIGDILRNRGCEVTICEDGTAALAAIDAVCKGDEPCFDLIISDIQMPDHNGYEVFASARQTLPDIPVILMTGFGYDPHHSIVRASQEGLRSVLFKPFQIEQLIDLVRRVFQEEHASQ